MNTKAKSLNLRKTNYANSHGLMNFLNKSTAYDMTLLSIYCMDNPIFAKIVSTKIYQTKILRKPKNNLNEEPQLTQIEWKNTHALLHTHS